MTETCICQFLFPDLSQKTKKIFATHKTNEKPKNLLPRHPKTTRRLQLPKKFFGFYFSKAILKLKYWSWRLKLKYWSWSIEAEDRIEVLKLKIELKWNYIEVDVASSWMNWKIINLENQIILVTLGALLVQIFILRIRLELELYVNLLQPFIFRVGTLYKLHIFRSN